MLQTHFMKLVISQRQQILDTWTFNINTSYHVLFSQNWKTDEILYKSIMVVVPNCTRTSTESRCDNPAGQTDRGGVGSVSRRMWHLCDQRTTGTGSWDNVPEEEAGTGAAAPQGGPAHNEPPIIGLEFSGPREIKQCVNCVNNIYWSYDG